MKAVADAPEARYATAAEMLDALNRSVDAVSYRLAARDLASWMAGTFSERQERMRSLVRTQLEQTSSKLIAVRGDSDELVPAADLSELRSSSSPQPVAHTRIRTRDLRTTGIVVGVALVALAVTAVVRLGVALRPTDATAVPSASVATAPASAPPAIEAVSAVPPPTGVAPEPALAEVYLSAMPHSARLFVDELEVPNPYATRRPVDSTPHTLRVEAKGFQRRILQIGPFQGRIDQTITLDPLGGGRHVVVSAPATKPHADQVAPAPSKAADCDSHFYRDANGILRVKPECVE